MQWQSFALGSVFESVTGRIVAAALQLSVELFAALVDVAAAID